MTAVDRKPGPTRARARTLPLRRALAVLLAACLGTGILTVAVAAPAAPAAAEPGGRHEYTAPAFTVADNGYSDPDTIVLEVPEGTGILTGASIRMHGGPEGRAETLAIWVETPTGPVLGPGCRDSEGGFSLCQQDILQVSDPAGTWRLYLLDGMPRFDGSVDSYDGLTLSLTTEPYPPAPTITAHPAAEVQATVGTPVTLTSSGSGYPAPQVQWWVVTPDGGDVIPGATSPDYTFTPTSEDHGRAYFATYANRWGSAMTRNAVIIIATLPQITVHPTAAQVQSGQQVRFVSDATSYPEATVQWKRLDAATGAPVDVPGATSKTLTLEEVTFADHGTSYVAVYTNPLGDSWTDPALLQVEPAAASVVTDPVDMTVRAGSPASFTAEATGDGIVSVQWSVATQGSSTFDPIPGATSPTYSLTSASADDDGNVYRAYVSNDHGGEFSASATLHVQYAPVILEHPEPALATREGDAKFTAAASGNPTPTVQWQVSTDDAAPFTDIPGATSPTLELHGLRYADSARYQAVFTNEVDSTTTGWARLRVPGTRPSLTVEPTDQDVLAGTEVTFTAGAAGDPTPSVQWHVITGSGQEPIPGATSATYTFTAGAHDDDTQYYAMFINVAGSVGTMPVTLTVSAAPVVTSSPADRSAPEGTTTTFTSHATGHPAPSVQWQVSTDDGTTFTDIDGATGATLDVVADLDVTGHQYRAVHTNRAGDDISDPATLSVLPLPVVVTEPTPQSATAGGTVTFSVRPDDPTATIQWQVSTDGGLTFSDLEGETDGDLTFVATPDLDGNLYRALFTTTGGTTATEASVLTVAAAPAPPLPAEGGAVPPAGTPADVSQPAAGRTPGGTQASALAVTGGDPGLLALAAGLLAALGLAGVTIARRRTAR
ncbi:immunoglobulin domain-containing protein [Cellulomonas dongxiuzhuiae]|uniref:Immunoglobulin domain-containing protein n=1 Tax=Cellulomonas dongxiuzhuiae TaxID=2819979 RepID=A0ABX8GKR8_9CELL|nr:immunoglobulin domain-containing protein [Cellulomonas dongxiuzhuiae]MBO3095508.1 immunoglobulin domain-containing protein [Cellulomonas dongxiuzhuiae]QWC16487.1 immunoglobulin domain-containing protein [Cellulomonas dongxiuzhuiae]